MTLTRRAFLQQTAALTASAALFSLDDAHAATVTRPGIQLYSLRDDMEKDARATIKSVAAMGYKDLEMYPGSKGFLWGMTPAEFKTYTKELGLTASTHTGIEKNMPVLMDQAAAAGMQNFVVSWLGKDERKTISDYHRIADEFNRLGEQAKQRGLTFGYHNHDYPYMTLDGELPIDVLLARTDPKLVKYEMDVFWVIEPGQDPVKYLQKYPGRFTMMHLKDRDPKNAKFSTIIGQGDLPMAKIMTAARKAGVKQFIVEVEEYGTLTPTACVEQSIAGLKKIVF